MLHKLKSKEEPMVRTGSGGERRESSHGLHRQCTSQNFLFWAIGSLGRAEQEYG